MSNPFSERIEQKHHDEMKRLELLDQASKEAAQRLQKLAEYMNELQKIVLLDAVQLAQELNTRGAIGNINIGTNKVVELPSPKHPVLGFLLDLTGIRPSTPREKVEVYDSFPVWHIGSYIYGSRMSGGSQGAEVEISSLTHNLGLSATGQLFRYGQPSWPKLIGQTGQPHVAENLGPAEPNDILDWAKHPYKNEVLFVDLISKWHIPLDPEVSQEKQPVVEKWREYLTNIGVAALAAETRTPPIA